MILNIQNCLRFKSNFFDLQLLPSVHICCRERRENATTPPMKFARRTKWFKALCKQRAEKLKLFIYAKTSKSVSRARVDRFYLRLYKSVKQSTTEKDAEDRFYAEEARILDEHRHFTYNMWMFCGRLVVRLCNQVDHLLLHAGVAKSRDCPALKRRLFDRLCKAGCDVDINHKVDEFFKEVHAEYALKMMRSDLQDE